MPTEVCIHDKLVFIYESECRWVPNSPVLIPRKDTWENWTNLPATPRKIESDRLALYFVTKRQQQIIFKWLLSSLE